MGNRIRWGLGVLFLTWLPISGITAAEECTQWAAKIASVQGQVEAKRAKTTNWQTAKLNDTYCPGDQIRVGANSRAAIVLVNETLLRLDQNSAIKLTSVSNKAPSLLELIKGIAHFISRVPRSLKIDTPFMNAAIEGTEFVVAIRNQQTRVTVFEGIVIGKNQAGEVRLTSGESAIASKGTKPTKQLIAKPRDAVQWALYYPPIIDPNIKKSDPVYQASALLHKGRVEAANKILAGLSNNGNAKALQAIIAVVKNDKTAALKLAKQAIELAPNSAATHIALSYAFQAHFELDNALARAQLATSKAPNNALAWARVAELQLSIGALDDALDAAQKASSLNDKLSRTQTILGYAHLVQINIDEAMAAFEHAIKLEQTDPLPRLGLGLAKIRRNDLEQGRREIEIAASLDPNNSIVRSYLGKAYFEEKRTPLDAEQFAMAKELDQKDPTPWFYDAILKQTQNRPVEALENLQRSIALNDNRAVYRSSLQLDQDEAARSASLGRIYQDLGFEQLALKQASQSLARNPADYSAHRLLADAYLSKPRHEIARVSELLQAKLLQPLNASPQQPQLGEGTLTLFNNVGPTGGGYNEYNNLFFRNGGHLVLNGVHAGNQTKGEEIVGSVLYDELAFSVSNYHYETDGFHANNGQEQDLTNVFVQAQVSNDLSVFFETNKKKETTGDAMRFDPENFSKTETFIQDIDGNRVGLRYKFTPNNIILATLLDDNRSESENTDFGIFGVFSSRFDSDNSVYEFQYIHKNPIMDIVSGISKTTIDVNKTVSLGDFIFTSEEFDREDSTVYLYSNWHPGPSIDLTLGISQDKYIDESFNTKKTNPKLGIIWHPSNNFNIRLAHTQTLRRTLVSNQTLETTMISGFNQFYDDQTGTKAKQSSVAFEYKPNNNLIFGFEYINRDLSVSYINTDTSKVSLVDWFENTSTAYAFWSINNKLSLDLKLVRESFKRDNQYNGEDDFLDVITYKLPIGLKVTFSDNLNSRLQFTKIDQEGNFEDISTADIVKGSNNFWVADAYISYKLPNRYGTFDFGVKNLFDEEFRYQETDPNKPALVYERLGFVRLNLVF